MKRITTLSLGEMKARGEKITVLTAYDYSAAGILDEAGIDVILVGDSGAMVMLGYENTLPMTMEDCIRQSSAVARGARRALTVADMPFMSFQVSPEDAVRNAGRIIKESGVQSVKVEGGQEIIPQIRKMTGVGIPVMGHVGLTPQSVHKLGGYRVQGRGEEAAQRIIDDARALEEAGIFALVLECVPSQLAAKITAEIRIPTIGIGAGPHCDGQVLVYHDLLGLYDRIAPKFVKRYAEVGKMIKEAVQDYAREVKEGAFPGPGHSYE